MSSVGTSAPETYLGLLTFAIFWAFFSGACVVACIHARERLVSWFWASSFGVASLVAAYCFGRLM